MAGTLPCASPGEVKEKQQVVKTAEFMDEGGSATCCTDALASQLNL